MANGQTYGTKKAGAHVTGAADQLKTGCSQPHTPTIQNGIIQP